jgi:hypothetical protein
MKILLDESVPQKLRLLIEGVHTVVTAWFQGWSGLTNGALLDAAEQAGLDLCVTADQEIRYQQNLAGPELALLVLSTNNWDAIRANVSAILAAIDAVTPGSYGEVKIPFH